MTVQQKTLGNLRTEFLNAQVFMNRDLFDILKANSLLEKFLETLRELWNFTIAALKESMDTGTYT